MSSFSNPHSDRCGGALKTATSGGILPISPWLLPLLLVLSLPAVADVQVRLSQGTITQYQPFQVIFESQGTSAERPDLSPLQRDFDIASQRFSSSTRTFNGNTSRRYTLNLSLVPRRSGDLVIPAIRFGQEESRAVPIKVTAGSPSDAGRYSRPSGMPGQSPGTGMPYGMPQQGYSQSYSYSTAPSGSPPEWGNMPGWGGTPGFPGWANNMPGMSGNQGWTEPPPTTAPSETEPAAATGNRDGAGYWVWIAIFALAGWLVTAVALWRALRGPLPARPRRRVARVDKPAATTTPKPVVKPPVDPLEELKKAYRSKDPFSAREALLHWAARIWPDDPPANLSRLAVRCPPHLQRHIFRLDEALYSPSSTGWSEESIWDELELISGGKTGEDAAPSAQELSNP